MVTFTEKEKELVFTADDWNKRTLTSPDTKSTQYENDSRVSAWRMIRSILTQEPIMIRFGMPQNWDGTTNPTVRLFLLVDDLAGAGTKVNIQIRADYKGDQADIPASPGGLFAETKPSGDITITEPPLNQLKEHRATVTLDATKIAVDDTVLLVIDRVAPTPTEYDQNIFLASANFRYESKEG